MTLVAEYLPKTPGIYPSPCLVCGTNMIPCIALRRTLPDRHYTLHSTICIECAETIAAELETKRNV